MPSKTLHILQRCYKSSKLFFKQQKIFFQFAYSVSSNVYNHWVGNEVCHSMPLFLRLLLGKFSALIPLRGLFTAPSRHSLQAASALDLIAAVRFPFFVVASRAIGGSLQGRAEGSRCRGSRLAERA